MSESQNRAALDRFDATGEATLKELIAHIVDDLFTNGVGQKADRLVLTVDSQPPRDLGGWGRAPLVDRITDLVRQATKWRADLNALAQERLAGVYRFNGDKFHEGYRAAIGDVRAFWLGQTSALEGQHVKIGRALLEQASVFDDALGRCSLYGPADRVRALWLGLKLALIDFTKSAERGLGQTSVEQKDVAPQIPLDKVAEQILLDLDSRIFYAETSLQSLIDSAKLHRERLRAAERLGQTSSPTKPEPMQGAGETTAAPMLACWRCGTVHSVYGCPSNASGTGQPPTSSPTKMHDVEFDQPMWVTSVGFSEGEPAEAFFGWAFISFVLNAMRHSPKKQILVSLTSSPTKQQDGSR